MKHITYLFIFILFTTLTGCGIYSFTGISLDPDTKTFQVNRFENTALLIEPGIERDFQNTLIQILENQTNLSNVNSNGDIVYEGEITEYSISPTTATAQSTAAQNRLTISVKIRFFNRKKEDDDLEQNFSFFYDYPGNAQLIGSQKTTAIEEIFERITQDVFNATLAKW